MPNIFRLGGSSGALEPILANGAWAPGITVAITRGTNYSYYLPSNQFRLNNACLKISGIPDEVFVIIKNVTQSTGGTNSSNVGWTKFYDSRNNYDAGNTQFLGTYNTTDSNGDGNGEYTLTSGYMLYKKQGDFFIDNISNYSVWYTEMYFLRVSDLPK